MQDTITWICDAAMPRAKTFKHRAYRAQRDGTMALQNSIAETKAKSWRALLKALNRNSWGRSCKMILGKLRPWVPPLTVTMDSNLLEREVNTLFPSVQEASRQPEFSRGSSTWSEQYEVSNDELECAISRLRIPHQVLTAQDEYGC